MTFTANLLASSSSGVEWSRPLMIGWLAIALALSVIEVWLLTGGFSSRRVSQISGTAMADDKKAVDRWENEGGRVSPFNSMWAAGHNKRENDLPNAETT